MRLKRDKLLVAITVIVMFWRMQAEFLTFNRLRAFWPKRYQVKPWEEPPERRLLKTRSVKKLSSTGLEPTVVDYYRCAALPFELERTQTIETRHFKFGRIIGGHKPVNR